MRTARFVVPSLVMAAVLAGAAAVSTFVPAAVADDSGKFELNGTVAALGATSFTVTPASMSDSLEALSLTAPYTINFDSTTKFKTPKKENETSADLTVGDRVNIAGLIQTGNSLFATKVNFRPGKLNKFELNGTVATVDSSSLTVTPRSMSNSLKNLSLIAPYTVNVDGSTTYKTSGMKHASLTDILPGDRGNIVGYIQSDNSLLATKINFKRVGFSIVGTIASKAASTFDVTVFVASNNTGLAHDAAATIDPTDNAKIKKEGETLTFAQLAVSDRVIIHGYITLSGTTKLFNATKIVVYP